MKFPQDFIKIRKEFKAIRDDPRYHDEVLETSSWLKNPLMFYSRVEAAGDEFLASFHNHTDGGNYELEDIARVGAMNGFRVIAVTNHRRDYQFEGNRVLYNKDYDVYLIRGMECRCEENSEHKRMKNKFSLRNLQYKSVEEHGPENDVIFVGYEGSIRDFQPFEETVLAGKKQKAIVIMTALGNRYAKGPSQERVLPLLDCFDAVEIFDSNHVGPLAGFEVVAKHFAEEHNLPGIYANDAHTLREIGCAGIGFKESDFPYLNSPQEVVDKPEILIDGIRTALKNRRFTNYGFHIPRFSVVYPSKAITLIRDSIIRPFDKSTGSWLSKKNGNGH